MATTAALIDAILEDADLPEHMVTRQDDEEMRTVLARHLTGWVHEHDRVPDELAGMSANDRGVWLSVERFYDAALRAEGVDRNARTMTPFRELTPDAQAAVIGYMVPAIQTVHQIALNPEARRG